MATEAQIDAYLAQIEGIKAKGLPFREEIAEIKAARAALETGPRLRSPCCSGCGTVCYGDCTGSR